MRELDYREKSIIHVLDGGICMNAPTIANNLGITSKEVHFSVNRIRKKYICGVQNAVYIHLSKNGYTLEETPENLKYEGRFRLKQGTSVILNGVHVYSRFKAISLNDYHQLRIAFQPKALKTIDLLSDDYSVIRTRRRQ